MRPCIKGEMLPWTVQGNLKDPGLSGSPELCATGKIFMDKPDI